MTYDAMSMTARLQREKYDQILTLLQQWSNRRKCIKRELLALIGLLAFACKVVKSGRIYAV